MSHRPETLVVLEDQTQLVKVHHNAEKRPLASVPLLVPTVEREDKCLKVRESMPVPFQLTVLVRSSLSGKPCPQMPRVKELS